MSLPQQLMPVVDNTLRSQIATQLRNMVIGGHYMPGERLTEQALASALQTSRAPIREAIRELVDQGILISKPYKGLFVREVSEKDLHELYSMRTVMEQFAARLYWPNRTPEALQELQRRWQLLNEGLAAGNDQAMAIECEVYFHSWVYEFADHQLLLSQWRRLVPLIQIYMSLHHRRHGPHGRFNHMNKIYMELMAGDSLDAMQEHIAEHMKQGLESVIKSLD